MGKYKPKEFAAMLGVSVKTLQRWDKQGKLKAYRTPTDRRYYTDTQLLEFADDNPAIADELKIGGKLNKIN